MKSFAFVVVAALLAATAFSARVPTMPGLNGDMPGELYAGYINVNQTANSSIYYMFATSQSSTPESDPLVLWLTGGPGCSGIIGFFTEHGPFNMNFTAQGNGIQTNPYTWAKQANVIYIESPVGVGYSYSDITADYATGDDRTKHDTYNFLQGFLKEFPQYRGNDFWVTGESYGGHYVPEITALILTMNEQVDASQQINLKGMMAGNPWTDPSIEAYGVVDNWWQRGMISETVYNNIYQYCDYKDITFWIINNVTAGGPGRMTFDEERIRLFAAKRLAEGWNSSSMCFDALKKGSMTQFGGINILGVYLDVCNQGTKGNIPDQPNYCADGQLTNYMNIPAVQQALHVRPESIPKGGWAECSNFVNHHYSAVDTETSMIPHYKQILASGIKVLVYSGDNDAIVPYTGTRRWIRTLLSQGLEIVNDVHEWYVNTNGPQVGGWATQYNNMTFTTVRDAGHMVPFMQPHRALYMFNTFIKEGKL